LTPTGVLPDADSGGYRYWIARFRGDGTARN